MRSVAPVCNWQQWDLKNSYQAFLDTNHVCSKLFLFSIQKELGMPTQPEAFLLKQIKPNPFKIVNIMKVI